MERRRLAHRDPAIGYSCFARFAVALAGHEHASVSHPGREPYSGQNTLETAQPYSSQLSSTSMADERVSSFAASVSIGTEEQCRAAQTGCGILIDASATLSSEEEGARVLREELGAGADIATVLHLDFELKVRFGVGSRECMREVARMSSVTSQIVGNMWQQEGATAMKIGQLIGSVQMVHDHFLSTPDGERFVTDTGYTGELGIEQLTVSSLAGMAAFLVVASPEVFSLDSNVNRAGYNESSSSSSESQVLAGFFSRGGTHARLP